MLLLTEIMTSTKHLEKWQFRQFDVTNIRRLFSYLPQTQLVRSQDTKFLNLAKIWGRSIKCNAIYGLGHTRQLKRSWRVGLVVTRGLGICLKERGIVTSDELMISAMNFIEKFANKTS